MQRTDVAIIGAGQAGLAMSACLGRSGIAHLVLERGRIGERWRSERRPGLRLLTPAWMTRLPGMMTPPGVHPDSFLPIGEFADLLAGYAATLSAPVLTDCTVLTVSSHGNGFRLVTSRGLIFARAVVVATGACDLPKVPGWAAGLSTSVAQVTPDAYRSPDHLPSGGVLVVGASATGMQIAADLAAAGRPVTLAVGRHVRAPRRYRGHDLFSWLDAAGFLGEPRPPGRARSHGAPSLPLVGGAAPGFGAALELAALHSAGARIVGRALGVEGATLHLSRSLAYEVEAAEARRTTLLAVIDRHVAVSGHPAAPEAEAWLPPAPLPAATDRLDLAAEGIGTIVWATGYRRSYPWLDLPVLGADGEILQDGGVTPVPGLYVLGLPFMRHRASALIDGVGRDASALSDHIRLHLGLSAPQAA
jgi:putative flavoprotein involved in K+ transport